MAGFSSSLKTTVSSLAFASVGKGVNRHVLKDYIFCLMLWFLFYEEGESINTRMI